MAVRRRLAKKHQAHIRVSNRLSAKQQGLEVFGRLE